MPDCLATGRRTRFGRLRDGVQVIDLSSGTCVDWFRIDGAVAELYDLAVLPGIGLPMAIAPGTADAASLITYRGRTPKPG